MAVQLNHTIVSVRDKRESATFLAEILGLDEPKPYGPFLVVQVDNDVSLDFADDHGPVHPQHYAFLVSDSDFDQIFGRIRARGLPYWADPGRHRPGETNANDGGRGVLGRTEWALPRDHHPPVRQRRLTGQGHLPPRRTCACRPARRTHPCRRQGGRRPP
jgi:catechol 2,3-dioxygenase-like lactoylglutathione lyase family enzyme